MNTPAEREFIRNHYQDNPSISIDYAIMEKAEHVNVIPADVEWSDLGAWPAMYSECEKNNEGNVIDASNTLITNTKGSVIKSNHEKKVYVVDGLEDFMVVDMDEVLFIVPRDQAARIKDFRSGAMEKFGDQLA